MIRLFKNFFESFNLGKHFLISCVIFSCIPKDVTATGDPNGFLIIGAVGLFVPSEFGFSSNNDLAKFYFGWDYQIPLQGFDKEREGLNHKLPLSINKRYHGFDYSIGYRYSYKFLNAGINYKYNNQFLINPELGTRICIDKSTMCLNFMYGVDLDYQNKFNDLNHSLSTIVSLF